MKRIFLALMLVAQAASVLADTYVQPYVRSDGTYVQGHHRSDANSSRSDNYSSRGNINPYTGERGYQNPYSNQGYGRSSSGYRYGSDRD